MAAFREVAKLMKPHTEFRLMVYNKGAFKSHQILEEYDYDYSHAEELIQKHSEAQTGCPVTHLFTPKSITSALEEVGMEVTSVEIDHIFPYKVEEYKRYEYVREDIWNMPEQTFREFEKRYGWHLLIKAKLK
jgi:poly-gamma-glutamate capsule biosynthesis protein CapA/YwtB (metallophosphatase superfamily)